MDAVYDVQSLTNSSSSNPRTPSPVLPQDDLQFAYMADSLDHPPPDPPKPHHPHYWQGSAPSTASNTAGPSSTATAPIPVPTNPIATATSVNGPFLNDYLNESASVASDESLYPGYFRADWALSAPAHDTTAPQSSTQPLSTTTPPHASASPQSVPVPHQDPHQPHPGLYRSQSYPAAHPEHDIRHRAQLAHHQHQHQHQHPHQHPQNLHHHPQFHSQHSQHHPHYTPQQPQQHQLLQHHPQQHHQQQQQQHPQQQHQQQQHQHQHQQHQQHQQRQQNHPSLMAGNHPQDASNVKLEHTSSMVVPSQLNNSYYRPGSSSSTISNVSSNHPTPTYIPSTMSSIPIMHTDDAASKETQYLRRKCFNCQTTEPPSWRRSTLNPGKIVCNKCGLYERTHNKPRPHQFGLRPGSKARKQTKAALDASTSPKPRHGITVKKDNDYGHPMRRGSVNGEWDDNYGNGAMYPNLGMHPPAARPHHHHPYAMPPPHHHQPGGIRLPQAPPMKTVTPPGMMSNSNPSTPYGSLPPSASVPAMYGNQLRGGPVTPSADYFVRRGSVNGPSPDLSGGIGPVRRHTVATSSPGPGLPMGGGGMSQHQSQHQPGMQDMSWQQPVPLSEMSVTPAPALANIGSAGSTPRKLMNGNGTPPPIMGSTSVGGSPNSAASAGAPTNAPTPAVAPTETARAAVAA